MEESIENIFPKKEQLCQEQEKDFERKVQAGFMKVKKQLEEQKSFKEDKHGDKREKEDEM